MTLQIIKRSLQEQALAHLEGIANEDGVAEVYKVFTADDAGQLDGGYFSYKYQSGLNKTDDRVGFHCYLFDPRVSGKEAEAITGPNLYIREGARVIGRVMTYIEDIEVIGSYGGGYYSSKTEEQEQRNLAVVTRALWIPEDEQAAITKRVQELRRAALSLMAKEELKKRFGITKADREALRAALEEAESLRA